MSSLRYDYDRDRDRDHGDGPDGSRGRAIIIFIIALVVIGCGIYFFILPHGPGNSENETPSPAATEAGHTPPTGSADSTAKPTEKTVPAPDQQQTSPGAPGNRDADGAETATAGKTAEATDAEGAEKIGDDVPKDPTDLTGGGNTAATAATATATATAAATLTPTEDPQKGKPWVDDPPSEQPASNEKSAEQNSAVSPRPVDPEKSAVVVAVRAGDSLSKLAQRHHTTVEALRHYNKLRKDVIRIDQKLRVIPGPWRITVDKKRRELTLERLTNGKWADFARFPVGLGRLNSTPDAQFVISTRLRHPDWYTADGRIYRYGDPENQLGDYFLKLAKTGAQAKPLLGYGIHGTPDEGSVGKNWSNGCVRMRNRDVEILYYLVPSGTPVKIVPGTDAPSPNGDMKHE